MWAQFAPFQQPSAEFRTWTGISRPISHLIYIACSNFHPFSHYLQPTISPSPFVIKFRPSSTFYQYFTNLCIPSERSLFIILRSQIFFPHQKKKFAVQIVRQTAETYKNSINCLSFSCPSFVVIVPLKHDR